MLQPLLLRAVAMPPKILWASIRATGISLSLCGMIFIFGFKLFGMKSIFLTMLSFFVLHGAAIFLTIRDPYFIETWIARIRCGKTKNFQATKENRYDP